MFAKTAIAVYVVCDEDGDSRNERLAGEFFVLVLSAGTCSVLPASMAFIVSVEVFFTRQSSGQPETVMLGRLLDDSAAAWLFESRIP